MARLFSRTPRPSQFNEFFGELALRLQRTDSSAPESSIEAIMQDIGEHYSVDRVHLRWAPRSLFVDEEGVIQLVAGWQRGNTGPGRVFAAQEVPWILDKIRTGHPIRLNDLDELPVEAAPDRLALQERGIQATLILGLKVDADMVGVFTLSTTKPFIWSDELQQEVTCLAELLTNFYWNINNRQKLRDSESRYRGVVEDQTDFIMRWAPDGTMNWVNARLCDYLQMSFDEAINASKDLPIVDANWPQLQSGIAKLTPDKPTMHGEYQSTLPNGNKVWQEWTDRGIFNEDGTLLEIQSVGRDITDRKMLEAAREREANFQRHKAELLTSLTTLRRDDADATIRRALARVGHLYATSRVGLWWRSTQGDVVTCTHRWLADGAPPSPLPDTISADQSEFVWMFERLLSGEKVVVQNLDEVPVNAGAFRTFMTKTDSKSYLALPLIIEGDTLGSVTVAATDTDAWSDPAIHELEILSNILATTLFRFRAAEELARREQDLKRSQSFANVGSYRLQGTINEDDPSGILNILSMEMSGQALAMFDIEAQKDAGAQVREVISRIHPDDAPRVREKWRESRAQNAEHVVEYRIVRRDESVIHVQAKEKLDHIDDNGVMTMFGTLKDITQWVESNQAIQTALLEIQQLKDQLQEENLSLRDEVRAAHGFDKIVGESAELHSILRAAGQVAPTDVTVLINGETGTGKELIARAIHDSSQRSDKPMVCVNCAALSPELIESELFGHEKGAFTGAHERRKGRFEIADGGTLFLDEIGELSGDLQAKLLRVIQEGEFERLGGSKTLNTNVRLIAATNRNLVEAMDSGEFRADLYYRINAFPLDLPPLRERKKDVPLLAEYLVRKHASTLGKDVTAISARTLRYLQEQKWHGNIRELEGTILRALISTTGPVLDFIGGDSGSSEAAPDDAGAPLSLVEAQRKHIVDTLEQTGWVIEGKKGAASRLGLAPSSLRSKMKRLEIVRPDRAVTT